MNPLTAPDRDRSVRERGFTLVELLIVIVILGILAGVTVFAVSNFTSTGTNSACQADYKTVQVAMESFKAQENSFPNKAVQTWLATYSSYDAVPGLLNKDPNGLGPWLLSPTTNGQHYRIEGTLDGNGTVKVMQWNDSNGSSMIGDGTIAACNSVH
jgi:prepilin-type N-terminal cleavage/methylation domain-containing protein